MAAELIVSRIFSVVTTIIDVRTALNGEEIGRFVWHRHRFIDLELDRSSNGLRRCQISISSVVFFLLHLGNWKMAARTGERTLAIEIRRQNEIITWRVTSNRLHEFLVRKSSVYIFREQTNILVLRHEISIILFLP